MQTVAVFQIVTDYEPGTRVPGYFFKSITISNTKASTAYKTQIPYIFVGAPERSLLWSGVARGLSVELEHHERSASERDL
jgi:hypothetical protein